MVQTSRELGFAFLAGSSVTVSRRIPEVEMPMGAELEEALCICPGGIDGYDIHGLEALQCMVERRQGGETGVVSLQALRDEKVWEALQAGSWEKGGWDMELFGAIGGEMAFMSEVAHRGGFGRGRFVAVKK